MVLFEGGQQLSPAGVIHRLRMIFGERGGVVRAVFVPSPIGGQNMYPNHAGPADRAIRCGRLRDRRLIRLINGVSLP